ncbi:MAG: hypothetical protein LVQ63_00660 [Thermoplasmatales archaeon]|nr:hypothetical protein [Thermoplasmatales archaeon]
MLVVSILIVLVIVFPLVGQGFYAGGNSGIHQDNVPSSYDDLTVILDDLVSKSNVGIAFFTPDGYVYFGNSTNGLNQPLLVNPTFSYPGIPTYGSPQVVSSYYFYWLYNEFYLNDTNNIAQLFGIMGVKYFVTLNGVVTTSSLAIANSVNPTKLMHYQKDIKLLYSTSNYSIFESTLDVNRTNAVSGFSVMSSDYNILMDAAALGINLSKIVPVFTGDINSSNFNFFLNNTASMILLNSRSLVTLSIDKFANSSDTIDPIFYTNSRYSSPYQGWMSSTSLETTDNSNILSNPYPFAITATNKSMSMNFKLKDTGNYTVWAKVLLSQSNSRMRFIVDGSTVLINNGSENITTGTFQWIRITFNARSLNNNLNITSLSGLNGIQRIVILKSGSVEKEISNIERYITSRQIPLLYLDNRAYQVAETGDYLLRIELKNNQNHPTGAYQESITLPNPYYFEAANSGLSNVQWQYSNGTIAPSRLGSYNSTSATWWLKVDNIPAHWCISVFVVFFPKDVNVLYGQKTGVSPFIDPRYDDGFSVFTEYGPSRLAFYGTNQFYPTNDGLYFCEKFYEPTGVQGNLALAGWSWSYCGGSDTPFFAAPHNSNDSQPFYWINIPRFLSPHILDGHYYLFDTAVDYPEAYWFINNTVVHTSSSSSFVNNFLTYGRTAGVNVSVLYLLVTRLPADNVTPFVSIQNVSLYNLTNSINSAAEIQNPVKLVNNPNGYSVEDIYSNITVVRYDYFKSMVETVKGFTVYPIMGGMTFILVSSGSSHVADFVTVDYKFLLYGVAVYVATIVLLIAYFVITFRKDRGAPDRK